MAHFAKFATGMTRINADLGGMEGSAYLSQTGDTVVAVMANPTDNATEMTFGCRVLAVRIFGIHRHTGLS